MRNHIGDLNDYLFEEIERLLDDDLSNKELTAEVKRAEAVTKVAGKIIDGASLVLRAEELKRKGVAAPSVILGDEKKGLIECREKKAVDA